MAKLPSSKSTIELLLAVLLVVANRTRFVKANSYVIDDERVRSLDIAPALGRGYSIATNQFHSMCLMVDDTTEPSYNYDYSYTDVSRSFEANSSTQVSVKVTRSFGWASVRASMEAQLDTSVSTSSHTVVTTMRIERYYSSVKEDLSPLSNDALTLLERKDHVGFFKACGPNYVRSIRRAQEVTAIFTFTSTDASVTASMKSKIQAVVYGQRAKMSGSSTTNINTSLQTLEIKIVGFGLGLDKEGSDTLVATSLEDYNAAMIFAYTSMTRGNQGSAQTGMVYGIEVVPWVNNPAFQVASDLSNFNAEITWSVPHELIPNQIDGACKAGEADGYGKCCLNEEMEYVCSGDITDRPEGADCPEGSQLYQEGKCCTEEIKGICTPTRPFHESVLKDNLQRNGEHVALMDSVLRHKMLTILTLERCVDSLRAMPESEDSTFLETPDSVLMDLDKRDEQLTVRELRALLDPDGQMSSSVLLGMELDEWLAMYYNPCMAAMFGMNEVAIGGSQPGHIKDYFLTKAWSDHPECAPRSCLIPSYRWNRRANEQGCTPSLAQNWDDKNGSEFDDDGEGKSCARKWRGTSLKCTRSFQEWKEKIDAVNNCWNGQSPLTLIEQYCTPRLSDMQKKGELNVCNAN